MKKYLLIVAFLLFWVTAHAAPTTTIQRTILPEANNTYDLGADARSWANIYSDFSKSGYFAATSTTATSTIAGRLLIGNDPMQGSHAFMISGDSLLNGLTYQAQGQELIFGGPENAATSPFIVGASAAYLPISPDLIISGNTVPIDFLLAATKSLRVYNASGGSLLFKIDNDTGAITLNGLSDGCLTTTSNVIGSAACGSGGSSNSKFSSSTTYTLTPNSGTGTGLVIGRTSTTTNSLVEVNGTTTATNFVATSSTNVNTFAGKVGISTTSPYSLLNIAAPAGVDSFAIGSSTETFAVNALGRVSMAGTQMMYLPNQTNLAGSIVYGSGGGKMISTATHNAFFGILAGRDMATGTDNAFFGWRSGIQTTGGVRNLAIGTQALERNFIGSDNVALGYAALFSNTGGTNVALGSNALTNSVAGNDSIAIGTNAFRIGSAVTGGVALGSDACYSCSGARNIAIGYRSEYLQNTGTNNVTIGYQAGQGNSQPFSSNVVIGYQAGLVLDSGADNNILIGAQAGDAITTGKKNIIIGYNIDATSTTATNSLNIGNLIFGEELNGSGVTISTGRIGVGTTTPPGRFSVQGPSANSTTKGTCFRAKDVGADSFTYWYYQAGVQVTSTVNCSGTGTTTITYD